MKLVLAFTALFIATGLKVDRMTIPVTVFLCAAITVLTLIFYAMF